MNTGLWQKLDLISEDTNLIIAGKPTTHVQVNILGIFKNDQLNPMMHTVLVQHQSTIEELLKQKTKENKEQKLCMKG